MFQIIFLWMFSLCTLAMLVHVCADRGTEAAVLSVFSHCAAALASGSARVYLASGALLLIKF